MSRRSVFLLLLPTASCFVDVPEVDDGVATGYRCEGCQNFPVGACVPCSTSCAGGTYPGILLRCRNI